MKHHAPCPRLFSSCVPVSFSTGGTCFGFFSDVNFFLAICLNAAIFPFHTIRLPDSRRFIPKESEALILILIPQNLLAWKLRRECFYHDELSVTCIYQSCCKSRNYKYLIRNTTVQRLRKAQKSVFLSILCIVQMCTLNCPPPKSASLPQVWGKCPSKFNFSPARYCE